MRMWREVAMPNVNFETPLRTQFQSGVLNARPSPPGTHPPRTAGLHRLELNRFRDGLIHIPYSYSPLKPAPLLMMLHADGGDASGSMALLIDFAEEHGIILVAPEAREAKWDLTERGYGPDAQFIDRALEKIFSQYAVDPRHIALAGFSDGGSYALATALGNGDLFTHAIGFSPGFFALRRSRKMPRVFITHGTLDQEFNIDLNSRRIVPSVRAKGFDVTYREFIGGHSVPRDVGFDAVEWFMAPADRFSSF